MLALYRQKHEAMVEKTGSSTTSCSLPLTGGSIDPRLVRALRQVRAFVDNIDHNFGGQSPAWRQIQSVEHRAERKQQIVDGIDELPGRA